MKDTDDTGAIAQRESQAVHGFPDATPLEEGDIVSVDVGVQLEGFFGDGAFTMGVGQIGPDRERLLETTRAALRDGIEAAQTGARLSDISHAVQRRAESGGGWRFVASCYHSPICCCSTSRPTISTPNP